MRYTKQIEKAILYEIFKKVGGVVSTRQIRVLHIVPNMHAAGLETFIMNMYRYIDKKDVQFDFLTHYSGKYFYDEIGRAHV